MEATSPRSPSQTSAYERGYDQGSYTRSSTYPSPARTEDDSSNYMTDSMVLYNQYPSMALPNHSVHPAQTLYPLSPHPTEAPWTPSLATTASPGMTDEQRSRVWTETYETMPAWDQPFAYVSSGSLVGARHSPALSDGALLSQRSSISSYDHSMYSQDESDSSWVKIEPQNELVSDEGAVLGHQPLTVSPQRLGNVRCTTAQKYSHPAGCKHPFIFTLLFKSMRANRFNSEGGTVNTSTVRTRSRSATTRENANHKCNLCGKLFQRSYNHNAHMDTHNPHRQRPNACKALGCGRRFVRRTDLVRHDQSVHLKVRNHKCTACDAHFARKDTLRRHTEDGCPKRFDVMARQAHRATSARRQRALPMRPPPHRAVPRNMSSLVCSTPYFHETFLPSPQ